MPPAASRCQWLAQSFETGIRSQSNRLHLAIPHIRAYNATSWHHTTRHLDPPTHIALIRNYSTPASLSLLSHTKIPLENSAGHILLLTLRSPHNKNALSRQLLSELHGTLSDLYRDAEEEWTRLRLEQDTQHKSEQNGMQEPSTVRVGQGVRAVVIASGLDDVFCAGADLKERRGMSDTETGEFLTHLRQTFALLSSIQLPTIAAISSIALGGGLELALSCTLRVIATTAIVGLPETRLGIIPGAGGTYRLRNLLGEAEALRWILRGARMNGREAYRIGLAQEIIACDELDKRGKGEKVLERAVEVAREICQGGPVGVLAALRAVRGASSTVKGGALQDEAENEMYEVVKRTEDRDEALRAFAEKRKPSFQGC